MTVVHPSVLWLNGAFGVGKSTAAAGVLAADDRWRAADPELLGAFLSDAERSWGQDVSAHPGWVQLVASGVRALAPTPERPVVVPMAVHDRDTWQALAAALGCRVLHVVLHAEPGVLLTRVEAGEPAALPWRRERLPAYEAASWLRTQATVLHTDLLTPPEVSGALLAGWDRVRGRTA